MFVISYLFNPLFYPLEASLVVNYSPDIWLRGLLPEPTDSSVTLSAHLCFYSGGIYPSFVAVYLVCLPRR